MNRLWNVIAMFFVLLCEVIGFSSCTNEDEKEFTADLTQYKWVCRSDQFSTSSTIEYDAYAYTFYFVSSTEGILHTYFKWMDSDGDGDNRTDNYFFTYTVKGNKINIKQDDGTTSQLTINSNGLLKDESDWIYTKESLTSSDRTFIAQETLNHQYYGNLDFGYDIGFNDFMNIAPQRNSDGTYSHTIHMTFGVPAEMLRRGVREFGIAVDVENGTVENATNKFTDDAYVKKRYVNGKNVTTFTTTVPDNNEHKWGVLLSVKSKSKDVLLKHAVVLNVGDMKIGDKYSSYFKRCDYDNKYVYRVGWVEDHYSFGGSSGSGDDDVSKEDGYENGHGYVDLGLSVKWAICNVGANAPEESGNFYAWGETAPQANNSYSWNSYKWCNGSSTKITKYGISSSYGIVDNKKTLEASDDAAHANWGGSWRMPTKDELDELHDKCTWAWIIRNGVGGRLVTGPNGKSIFLPAAGCRNDGSFYAAGGQYWSSSLYKYNASDIAYLLKFTSSNVSSSSSLRDYGCSVRAVCSGSNGSVLEDENGNDNQGGSGNTDDNNGNGGSQSDEDSNRGPVATSFRGNGTKNDPYIISNASELRKLADDGGHKGDYFKMTADITINHNVLKSDGSLNGNGSNFEEWIPIVSSAYFDGGGHTISGIYINSGEDYKGLFRNAYRVENLTLKDSYIKGGRYVGMIACAGEKGVENCVNYATIVGTRYVGGVVGLCNNNLGNDEYSSINKCINYGTVTGSNQVGGICGLIDHYPTAYMIIKNCVNYGTVTGNSDESMAGGISFNSRIYNCANFGTVNSKYAAGLVYEVRYYDLGENRCGKVSNCVSYAQVVGEKRGAICVHVSADSYTKRHVTITDAYYSEFTCPLAIYEGENYATIKNCVSKSSSEMKSQSFLDELNKNVKSLGSGYCQWKFGKDGYPTLDFVNK